MLGCETEDVDAIQQGEDVRRDDFICEHPSKGYPENLDSLEIGLSIEVKNYF